MDAAEIAKSIPSPDKLAGDVPAGDPNVPLPEDMTDSAPPELVAAARDIRGAEDDASFAAALKDFIRICSGYEE